MSSDVSEYCKYYYYAYMIQSMMIIPSVYYNVLSVLLLQGLLLQVLLDVQVLL